MLKSLHTSIASSEPCNKIVEEVTVAAPIAPSQIAIVKSTAPLLKEHGVEITSLFYKNMLQAHPELHNIFSRTGMTTGAQPRALAAAVFAYASYVDDLGKLSAAVERIAHKHVSLGIEPDQYAIVGKYLIEAVAAVLGDAVTAEVADAWTAAYGALADIFINRERQLYSTHGEWMGWRKFRIRQKVAETAEITSFHLVPEDGKPLPLFKAGQYVSVRIFVPQLGCLQPRQYSLSDAPQSNCYRISVKKDLGKEKDMPGLISNLLHKKYREGDVVELTHPTGDFFVDPQLTETSPLVLISAGVGITPMISILDSIVSTTTPRAVSWIHGARSTKLQAFRERIQAICKDNPNVQATIFKSSVAASDMKGVDYDINGRVDLEKVDRTSSLFLDNSTTNYYICGPGGFMRSMGKFLASAGVPKARIHTEVYGVGDEE